MTQSIFERLKARTKGFSFDGWDSANERVWNDSVKASYAEMMDEGTEIDLDTLAKRSQDRYDAVEGGAFWGNFATGAMNFLEEVSWIESTGGDLWLADRFTEFTETNAAFNEISTGTPLEDIVDTLDGRARNLAQQALKEGGAKTVGELQARLAVDAAEEISLAYGERLKKERSKKWMGTSSDEYRLQDTVAAAIKRGDDEVGAVVSALEEWALSGGAKFWDNPFTKKVLGSSGMISLGIAGSTMGGAAVGSVLGPGGTIAGAGGAGVTASYLLQNEQEQASGILEALYEMTGNQLDMTNPEQVAKVLASLTPEQLQAAKDEGTKKAATIAAFDGVAGLVGGMGVAGAKMISTVLKGVRKARLARVAAGAAYLTGFTGDVFTGATLGGAGEYYGERGFGSTAAPDKDLAFAMVNEVIGEVAQTGPMSIGQGAILTGSVAKRKVQDAKADKEIGRLLQEEEAKTDAGVKAVQAAAAEVAINEKGIDPDAKTPDPETPEQEEAQRRITEDVLDAVDQGKLDEVEPGTPAPKQEQGAEQAEEASAASEPQPSGASTYEAPITHPLSALVGGMNGVFNVWIQRHLTATGRRPDVEWHVEVLPPTVPTGPDGKQLKTQGVNDRVLLVETRNTTGTTRAIEVNISSDAQSVDGTPKVIFTPYAESKTDAREYSSATPWSSGESKASTRPLKRMMGELLGTFNSERVDALSGLSLHLEDSTDTPYADVKQGPGQQRVLSGREAPSKKAKEQALQRPFQPKTQNLALYLQNLKGSQVAAFAQNIYAQAVGFSPAANRRRTRIEKRLRAIESNNLWQRMNRSGSSVSKDGPPHLPVRYERMNPSQRQRTQLLVAEARKLRAELSALNREQQRQNIMRKYYESFANENGVIDWAAAVRDNQIRQAVRLGLDVDVTEDGIHNAGAFEGLNLPEDSIVIGASPDNIPDMFRVVTPSGQTLVVEVTTDGFQFPDWVEKVATLEKVPKKPSSSFAKRVTKAAVVLGVADPVLPPDASKKEVEALHNRVKEAYSQQLGWAIESMKDGTPIMVVSGGASFENATVPDTPSPKIWDEGASDKVIHGSTLYRTRAQYIGGMAPTGTPTRENVGIPSKAQDRKETQAVKAALEPTEWSRDEKGQTELDIWNRIQAERSVWEGKGKYRTFKGVQEPQPYKATVEQALEGTPVREVPRGNEAAKRAQRLRERREAGLPPEIPGRRAPDSGKPLSEISAEGETVFRQRVNRLPIDEQETRYLTYLEAVNQQRNDPKDNPEVIADLAARGFSLEEIAQRNEPGVRELWAPQPAFPEALRTPTPEAETSERQQRIEGEDYAALQVVNDLWNATTKFLRVQEVLKREGPGALTPEEQVEYNKLQRAIEKGRTEEEAAKVIKYLESLGKKLNQYQTKVAEKNNMTLDEYMALDKETRFKLASEYDAAKLVEQSNKSPELLLMGEEPWAGKTYMEMTSEQMSDVLIWRLNQRSSGRLSPERIVELGQTFDTVIIEAFSQGKFTPENERLANMQLDELLDGVVSVALGQDGLLENERTAYAIELRAIGERVAGRYVGGKGLGRGEIKTLRNMLKVYNDEVAKLNAKYGFEDRDVDPNLIEFADEGPEYSSLIEQEMDDAESGAFEEDFLVERTKGEQEKFDTGKNVGTSTTQVVGEKEIFDDPREQGRQISDNEKQIADLQQALDVARVEAEADPEDDAKQEKVRSYAQAIEYLTEESADLAQQRAEAAKEVAEEKARRRKPIEAETTAEDTAALEAELEAELQAAEQTADVAPDDVTEEELAALLSSGKKAKSPVTGSVYEQLEMVLTSTLRKTLSALADKKGEQADNWRNILTAEIESRTAAFRGKGDAAGESASQTLQPTTDTKRSDSFDKLTPKAKETVVETVVDTAEVDTATEATASTDVDASTTIPLDPETSELDRVDDDLGGTTPPTPPRPPILRDGKPAPRQRTLKKRESWGWVIGRQIGQAFLTAGRAGERGDVDTAILEVGEAVKFAEAVRSRVFDYVNSRFQPAIKRVAQQLDVPEEVVMSAVARYANGTLGAKIGDTYVAETEVAQVVKDMRGILQNSRVALIGDSLITQSLETTIREQEFHIHQSVQVTNDLALILNSLYGPLFQGSVLDPSERGAARTAKILNNNPAFVRYMLDMFGTSARTARLPTNHIVAAAKAGWYGEALQDAAEDAEVSTKELVHRIRRALHNQDPDAMPTEKSLKKGMKNYVNIVGSSLGAVGEAVAPGEVQQLYTNISTARKSLKTTRDRVEGLQARLKELAEKAIEDEDGNATDALQWPELAEAVVIAQDLFDYNPSELELQEYGQYLKQVWEAIPNKDTPMAVQLKQQLDQLGTQIDVEQIEAAIWRAAGQRRDPSFGIADTAYRVNYARTMGNSMANLIETLFNAEGGALITSNREDAESRYWVNLADFFGEIVGPLARAPQAKGTIESLADLQFRLPKGMFGNKGGTVQLRGSHSTKAFEDVEGLKLYVPRHVAVSLAQTLGITTRQTTGRGNLGAKIYGWFSTLAANNKAGLTAFFLPMHPRNWTSMAGALAARFHAYGDSLVSPVFGTNIARKAGRALTSGLGRNFAELGKYAQQVGGEIGLVGFAEDGTASRAMGDLHGITDTGWQSGHLAATAMQSMSDIYDTGDTLASERVGGKVAKSVGRLTRALQSTFKAGDEGPRIAAMLNQTLNLYQVLTGKSYAEATEMLDKYGEAVKNGKVLIDEEGNSVIDDPQFVYIHRAMQQAAREVRDATPTWSRALPLSSALSKMPVLGAFITFHTETQRNAVYAAIHTIRATQGKLPDGTQLEGEQAVRMKRLGWAKAVANGAYYTASISGSLLRKTLLPLGGKDPEDDEAWETWEKEAILDTMFGANEATMLWKADPAANDGAGAFYSIDWGRVIPEATAVQTMMEAADHLQAGRQGDALLSVFSPYLTPEPVLQEVIDSYKGRSDLTPQAQIDAQLQGDYAAETNEFMQAAGAASNILMTIVGGRYHKWFSGLASGAKLTAKALGIFEGKDQRGVDSLRAAVEATTGANGMISDEELRGIISGNTDFLRYVDSMTTPTTLAGMPTNIHTGGQILMGAVFNLRESVKLAAATATLTLQTQDFNSQQEVAKAMDEIYQPVREAAERIHTLAYSMQSRGGDIGKMEAEVETRLGVPLFTALGMFDDAARPAGRSTRSVAGISMRDILNSNPDNVAAPALRIQSPKDFAGRGATFDQEVGDAHTIQAEMYSRNAEWFNTWSKEAAFNEQKSIRGQLTLPTVRPPLGERDQGAVADPTQRVTTGLLTPSGPTMTRKGPNGEVDIWTGDAAIEEVAKIEGISSDQIPERYKTIIREEGFSKEPYFDPADPKDLDKITQYVGQTREYRGMSPLTAIQEKERTVRGFTDGYDDLPEDVKTALLSSHYRGSWSKSGSPEAVRLFNEGKYVEAAAEFLDRDEYRKHKASGKLPGIVERLERTANAIRSLGAPLL